MKEKILAINAIHGSIIFSSEPKKLQILCFTCAPRKIGGGGSENVRSPLRQFWDNLQSRCSFPVARKYNSPEVAMLLAVLANLRYENRTVFVGIQMNSLIGWILLGLIAGWLTGKITRGAGFGCIGDVLIGMVGAILGGWIFSRLGILGGGFLFSLAAAVVGAVILVSVARLLSGGR